MMATIFTAGGLVVAMVSVLTFMQLEKTITQAVERSSLLVRADMEERTEEYLLAYTSLRLAQDAWYSSRCDALEYIREQLDNADVLQPPLKQSRIFGGMVHLLAARIAYLQDQISFDSQYMIRIPASNDIPRLSAIAMPLLDFAVEKVTGSKDQRTYPLLVAQCQALLGESATRIARSLRANRTDRGFERLSSQGIVAMLASCKRVEEAREILDTAEHSVLTQEEVLTYLRDVPKSEGVFGFAVYAAKPDLLQKPRSGAFRAIFRSPDGFENATVEWMARPRSGLSNEKAGLPLWPEPDPSNGGAQTSPPFEPIQTLLSRLFEALLFLGPLQYQYDPWYLP
jgi:hypothetical protein